MNKEEYELHLYRNLNRINVIYEDLSQFPSNHNLQGDPHQEILDTLDTAKQRINAALNNLKTNQRAKEELKKLEIKLE